VTVETRTIAGGFRVRREELEGATCRETAAIALAAVASVTPRCFYVTCPQTGACRVGELPDSVAVAL